MPERTMLLRVTALDDENHNVAIHQNRQPEFDKYGYGGLSAGFVAHSFEISQIYRGEGDFGLTIEHTGLEPRGGGLYSKSGFHKFSKAQFHDLQVRMYSIGTDMVEFESDAFDPTNLILEEGEFHDKYNIAKAWDRQLVLPIAAGVLTVGLSTAWEFAREPTVAV